MSEFYKEAVFSLQSFTCKKLQDFSQTRMRVILFSALTACAAVLGQSSVDSYVAAESPIAKAGMLANIGPSGSKSLGAKYVFTWVRDSSLVFKVITDQFTTGQDTTLLGQIQNFITAESNLQQVTNPSGTISTGGLGEPKFNIDGTAFTDPWGRSHGPALRSTTMITYANWLLKNTSASNVLDTLWPTIKLDLDYVAANWNQLGAPAPRPLFDLWEEISSSSFWTTAVQHRSLREGATLATALGQDASAYTTQADNVLCFLQTYWNGEFITSNTGGGRSGKDANSALASIHTFDPAAGCDAATFQPCSDKALASLKVYVDAFRSIYTLNAGIAANAAVATGRYPEDVYMGGNPWYLPPPPSPSNCTTRSSCGRRRARFDVTSISLAFFRQFDTSVAVGTYAASTSTFTSLTAAVQTFADGFLAIHAKYTPANGGLAEQFDRNNGTALSAVDLTWSYAAALTVFSARAGAKPVSWGAAGLVVPSVCEANGGGGTGNTIPITFNVVATTVEGEDIYLTGSVDALKDWSPDNAIILSPANYPTWSVTVNVQPSTQIEYKYIRKSNGVLTSWESDPNNQFTSPATGSFVLNDNWK
ncbi:glucoamylase [Mycena filopes]|nr:glucoamylase [Mycena filopes]